MGLGKLGVTMSDEAEDNVPMAECGACRAIIRLDSKKCFECGVKIAGVSDEALGECGACNSLVPLDSKSCPDCGVFFVADDVLDVLREWFNNTGIDSRMLFSKFDSDSDGYIDADELKTGLLKLNLADLPPSQIDRLINEVDTDNDSVISLDELVVAISGQEAKLTDEVDDEAKDSVMQYSDNVLDRVMKKFSITDKDRFLAHAKAYDENDNDYLTEAELKKAAESYSDSMDVSDDTTDVKDDTTVIVNEDASNNLEPEEAVDNTTAPDDSDAIDEPVADEVEITAETDETDEAEISEMTYEDDEISDVENSATVYLASLFDAAKNQDMTIRSMFESMDLDDSGVIDGPELQKGINQIAGDYLSPGQVMEIISLVDKDSDGRINAYELIEIIETMNVEMESDSATDPVAILVNYMDKLDINPGALFKDLDKNGDGQINRDELANALSSQSNDDIDETSISNLMTMFDADGDDNIDLIEFIDTLETIDEEEPEEEAALSTAKEFPSKLQKRMMSKKWKDVVWPLIHTGFVFFILLWIVNGTLAPFVDGNGGIVTLDTEFGQAVGEDGTLYNNGDSYPCDDEIQIGGCKNSLTPLAGEGGEISMPAGFYWDATFIFIPFGVIGLLAGLITQYYYVPKWRARVKAMRDNESEKEEVMSSIIQSETESSDASEPDDDDPDETESTEADEQTEEGDYDDEIDVGSYIGLVLEDEEVYGTIIEFDDDEGLVTIEEDGTGDLVTGYQDDMFLED